MVTNFMKMVGTHMMSFNVSSTISWGQSRLRVALVLDNTGSMNARAANFAALEDGYHKSLLGQLKGAATSDGDVYVSIVPFVKDVNVDPSNYSCELGRLD